MDDSNFGERLGRYIRAKRSSVCVGLDPRWNSLPEIFRGSIESSDLTSIAVATGEFCKSVVDAVADCAPVVKPQAAFFEQLGPSGMHVLAEVIDYAQRSGLLVLLDAKRGDIGSTAEAYADAYLGRQSAWHCDALTVNPYLGDDTLQPFVDAAEQRRAGLFVLVKTSNPGSGFMQDLVVKHQASPNEIKLSCETATSGNDLVFERVADWVQSEARKSAGTMGYGDIGAVVGATYPEQLAAMRARMPQAWILIPGFGAQGGTAADVRHGFDANGLGAIVNSSRGIIFASSLAKYKSLPWQDAIAVAAREMRDELTADSGVTG